MFSRSVLGSLKLEFFESIIAWFLALISLFVSSLLSVLSREVAFSGFLIGGLLGGPIGSAAGLKIGGAVGLGAGTAVVGGGVGYFSQSNK